MSLPVRQNGGGGGGGVYEGGGGGGLGAGAYDEGGGGGAEATEGPVRWRPARVQLTASPTTNGQ